MEIAKHMKIKELVREVRKWYFTENILLTVWILSVGFSSPWTNE